MVVYRLDDLPAYEALSYTWGDISVTKTISCNGLLLRVPSNAWQALIDLRRDDDDRILWVDAICINQDDPTEKGLQVQLMRHIYARANKVPIWIKPVSDDMTLVFSILSTLSRLWLTENVADHLNPFTAVELTSRGLPNARNEIWKAVDDLLWNPCFFRIWIIQEISLAREAFLVSGSASCPWENVKRAAQFIHNHSLTLITDVDPSQALRLESMVKNFRDGTSVFQLAQLARSSKSTDPRDKIYGLLGLASDGHELEPNYIIAAQESYKNFALQVIQQQQSLTVLNAVEHWGHYATGQIQFVQLPSWAPNWTLSGLTRPLPQKAQLEHSALTYTVSPRRCILHVKGVELGIIRDSGDTFLEFIPQSGNSVPELSAIKWVSEFYYMKRWRQWECMAAKVSAYPTSEPVRSAYIRTIIADSLEQQTSDAYTLEEIYDLWVKFWRIVGLERGRFFDYYSLNTPSDDQQHAFSFMAAHATASYGRRFFVTSEGYFGLGPFQSRKGDRVVALCGGKTPYVLRRYRVKRSVTEWKILGECYLHGVQRDILKVKANHQTFSLA